MNYELRIMNYEQSCKREQNQVYLDYAECSRLKAKPIMALRNRSNACLSRGNAEKEHFPSDHLHVAKVGNSKGLPEGRVRKFTRER